VATLSVQPAVRNVILHRPGCWGMPRCSVFYHLWRSVRGIGIVLRQTWCLSLCLFMNASWSTNSEHGVYYYLQIGIHISRETTMATNKLSLDCHSTPIIPKPTWQLVQGAKSCNQSRGSLAWEHLLGSQVSASLLLATSELLLILRKKALILNLKSTNPTYKMH